MLNNLSKEQTKDNSLNIIDTKIDTYHAETLDKIKNSKLNVDIAIEGLTEDVVNNLVKLSETNIENSVLGSAFDIAKFNETLNTLNQLNTINIQIYQLKIL